MRRISLVVIHCSASDNPNHDNVETIRQWHLERGFSDIGYHYVITRDGVCHDGRPLETPGAHVEGFNANSIGICLTGIATFTPAQFETLASKLKGILKDYTLERASVVGHHHLNPRKDCPCFDVQEFLNKYEVN